MSGVLDLLNSDLGRTIINGVSGHTNQPQNKTQDVLGMAIPVLMQAMKRNVSTSEGAEGLISALNTKHDGSILDNLGDLFNGGVNSNILTDGSKILSHILGNKQQNVENALSEKSGISVGSIAKILTVTAPILMGLVGKQTRQQNANTPSGLENVLGSLIKGNSSHNQSFLESILDADNNGSIIDDVAGMILGDKNKTGLGGRLLGGLFGKK